MKVLIINNAAYKYCYVLILVEVISINLFVTIGKEVDFDEPHLAAVLLKQFLRELPEPVLMYSTYSKLRGFKGNEDIIYAF